ncbi:MAG: MoaD family protein [Methanomassiliicoccus sp.]|nr:MoaD family protein [Methanomassiliicoccus sp.]
MIRVTVRTYGHMSQALKGTSAEIEFDGRTVGDLLAELITRYGAPLQRVLYPRGDTLSDMIYVLVNGKNIAHSGGVGAPLAAGDTVTILPITAGG